MDHEPVLLKEVIAHFENQGKFIDATLGAGGYNKALCERGGKVLGIDTDPIMLKIARKNLSACPDSFYSLINGNFRDIEQISKDNGFSEVDGVVFDLGVSNIHFKDMDRGFSFKNPESLLDMRLNPNTQELKASDLLNTLRLDQLEDLFSTVLDLGVAKRISKQIIKARESKKIETVGDFLKIVNRVFIPVGKLHPATKAFLALRIAVNSELDSIATALPRAFPLLTSHGKLAVVSFHSLEDSIVKNYFRSLVSSGFGKLITKKPIVPTEEEIMRNPKSRSAKLRVIEKI